MSEPSPLAGVDIGGTGLRLRVCAADREVERRLDGPVPRRRGRIDVRALALRVAAELRPALDELGADHVAGLGVGMTGIPGLVDESADLVHHLAERLSLGVVAVSGDALTAHLGALSGEPGAVVAAGTGVITFGTDLRDHWRQVDGWGVTLGDEGSGAWIGRHGLRAALHAWDGRRGGSTTLLTLMREQFGDPLDLVGRIYPAESTAHELATFAPAVAGAARAGDPVAAAIWRQAAEHLADAAVAALVPHCPVVSWNGGLFAAGDLLLDPFRAHLHAQVPQVEVRTPVGAPVDGALHLARRALGGCQDSRPPYLFVHRVER